MKTIVNTRPACFSYLRIISSIWLAAMAVTFVSNAAGIVTNGGFESGLSGWRPLWTRDAHTGTLTLDAAVTHTGKQAARIEHRGQNDWSFESLHSHPPKP
ncbi:MAG: hypothetical protein WCJ07_15265 [Verrucomicrobiota bacterium]